MNETTNTNLTCSEKQLTWATEIRKAYIAAGANGATTGTSAFRSYANAAMTAAGITQSDLMPRRGELMAMIQVAFDRICANTAAAWWIDNRSALDAALAAEWVSMVRKALGK